MQVDKKLENGMKGADETMTAGRVDGTSAFFAMGAILGAPTDPNFVPAWNKEGGLLQQREHDDG